MAPRVYKAAPLAIDRNMSSRFLRSVLFALAAYASLNGPALAAYPDRIIKIVVPFAPGGGTDVVARTLAQEMAKDLGASIIIENKPGAGTIIGTQSVATSAPDGYTLLMGTFANAVNPSLNAKLPYDAHRDFAAVALVARSFNIVVVNPASPITSIADLIAAAKAEPDKLSYGTYGTGTSAHLAGELFKHMAGVNLTTVPYKGAAPAITDLLGAQIQVMFTTVASCASLVAAGQLRAIAVTSAERSPAFPQLPTVSEAVFPATRQRPGMACMRRPKRRPISSTASTNRPQRPCSPMHSKSSASMKASSWWRSLRKRSTATSAAKKSAGAR
jgi:tripartite-type tricarboxylate transporter receptor subunit TctC